MACTAWQDRSLFSNGRNCIAIAAIFNQSLTATKLGECVPPAVSPHKELGKGFTRIMATTIKLTVNGKAVVLKADDPSMPLLYALRDQLGLHGMHFGCGLAQCGACTVHYYGEALRSCVMPVSAVAGAEIVTLEGLGTAEKPHPVQQAFIDEQAAQCGYCINGMIMQAAAFLATTKRPTEDQIRQALAGNLCKCGTHVRILRAVMRAAEKMA